VAGATKARYVNVGDPSLAIDCPRCGLRAARFMEFCSNCGYSVWPTSAMASAAFGAWKEHDLARADARPFDRELPSDRSRPLVDYEARAHELGVHITPNSNNPILICAGMFFMGFAFVPLPGWVRVATGVVGAILFFWGVIGWVIVEDTQMFPRDDVAEPHETAH